MIVVRKRARRDAGELSLLVIMLPTQIGAEAVACRVVTFVGGAVVGGAVVGVAIAGVTIGGMASNVRGVKVVPDERVQPLSQQGNAAKKGRKSRSKWPF